MAEVDTQQLDMLLNAVRALEPLIRKHADEAERNCRLSQPVVTALAEAGLFRLYTPRTLGGLEVDPLTFYRVMEDIARIDGSTGWCVWIGSQNPVFVPNLADQAAEEVFGRDPHVVTASVFFPYGKAEVRDDGYVVSGRWPYASGCQHSAWLFPMCNVFEADQMRLTESGEPEVRLASVSAEQVTILDTWEVSGLAGTGSHDVVVEQVFVPEGYTSQFGPGVTLPRQALPGSAVPLSLLRFGFRCDRRCCVGHCPRGSRCVYGIGSSQASCWDDRTPPRSTAVSRPASGSSSVGALSPCVAAHCGAADVGGDAG